MPIGPPADNVGALVAATPGAGIMQQVNKKYSLPPSNVVYVIDGASYGLDDGLVEAIKTSICRRIEAKTLDIPRLPQVASRILELSGNPDTSVDDIVHTVATDPVLATRLLAIANSAAYAGGDRIEGLKPALLRLGTKVVKDAVFAESIRMKIFSSRSYRALLEESWKLSLGTAIACEALAKATGLERDGAFLLGLLHDTGKPVLVNAVAEYERQNGGRALGQEVVEILIVHLHEEIGAYVLGKWGMPPSIVAAAGAHHHYRNGGRTPPASCLVYAGNLICQHLGIGDVQRDVDFSIEHVFVELQLADCALVSPILETVTSEFESLMAGMHQN
jgi:HD-like signal output (HDOD) protein